MSDVPNTSGPVFGPRLPRSELANPLGKMIKLRIELEGCKWAPPAETSSESSDSRPSHFVCFDTTSRHPFGSRIKSSKVQEGVKSLRGTVQWNEVHFLLFLH
ncbi:hypothetical protein PENSPDRAFT_17696 [Peniophora sp. CONT]|nr:hypothetical protein PENSPDRAFT_17696 [Peniophora sp. CONT]